MDFSGTGCTLAKVDEANRNVELIRITPWLELDPSAMKEGYGLWDVSSTSIDFDDMSPSLKMVQDAINSRGLDTDEYVKLDVEYKAVVIAYSEGYPESHSTSDFGKALPVSGDRIEWWTRSAKFDAASINEINNEMRREATNNLYGGHLFGRKIPSIEALKFALGDQPLEMDLDDDETQAVRYALAMARGKTTWDKPQKSDNKLKARSATELIVLLDALTNARESKDLNAETCEQLFVTYTRDFDFDWEDKHEQVMVMITEDAKSAKELARTILQNLGF